MNVLIGYMTDGEKGGIDRFLMRFLELNKDKNVSFYILVNKVHEGLRKKVSEYNGVLIEIPSLKHPIKQYFCVNKFLDKTKCDIAYFNISEAFHSIAVISAKRKSVKKICIHSHSSGIDKQSKILRMIRKSFHMFFKQLIPYMATDYYACSKTAAIWMFPKRLIKKNKVKIIYNTIDFSKFVRDEKIREKIRKTYGLDNSIIVGHVGSYCYAKNNFFLVDIMEQLVKINSRFFGFFIGDGVDFEKVKEYAKKKKVEKNIVFLGNRGDVNKLLNAIDIFILPSRFEGLPISAIEAQTMGIPCLLSKNISEEVRIFNRCYFLELRQGPYVWAKKISEIYMENSIEEKSEKEISKYMLDGEKDLKEILYIS